MTWERILQWQNWCEWSKFCIKSLAEVNLFRQVNSLSKAISRFLSYCGASLSDFQCFGSPEACLAFYLLPFSLARYGCLQSACLWQEQPSLWVYLPAPQIPGDLFLLVERGDFAPLKSCTAWCLFSNSEVKQLNFPLQNPNRLSPLGPSGLWAVWMSLQTSEGVSLTKQSTCNPNNLIKTGMPLYGLPDREQSPSSILLVTSHISS